MLPVFVGAVGVGALVAAIVLFLQRSSGVLDASPRTFVRVYLYLAVLASLALLAYGVSALGSALLASVAPDLVFGAPAAEGGRPSSFDASRARQVRDLVVQGAALGISGALFAGLHWYGRRLVERPAAGPDLLRRAYDLAAVVAFGATTIIAVPAALASGLRFLVATPSDFRMGVGESAVAALVAFVVWLAYFRALLAGARTTPAEAA